MRYLFVFFISLALMTAAPGADPGDIQGMSSVEKAFSALQEDQPLRLIGTVDADPNQVSTLGIDNATREAVGTLSELMTSNGATLIKTIPNSPYVVFTATQKQLDQLLQSGRLGSVSVDQQNVPFLESAMPPIHAPQVNQLGANGAGRTVVILDSGVQAAHPFLGGRVVAEACFSSGTTSLCPNHQTTDFGSGSGEPCTLSGCDHGTHVAGIVAGSASARSGAAPRADIIAIQVFSSGPDGITSNDSDLLDALVRVRDVYSTQFAITSVNLSLGVRNSGQPPCPSNVLASVIGQLRAMNIATVIAAGNDGSNAGATSPACIPAAVSIGATDDALNIANFSNFASTVDLMAPGVSITSSVPGTGATYASMSGTSMATPVAAGAFADLAGYFSSSVDETETALESTGTLVHRPAATTPSRPKLDLLAALQSLQASTPATAFPLIKDVFGDTGKEPDPAANGHPVSESPYIWIRNQQGQCQANAHQHQNPIAGQANFGCVQVDNPGSLTASGTLELYYGKADLNNAANFTLIGSTHVTAPSHTTTMQEFIWANLPAPGHYCLLARFVPDANGSPPLTLPGGLDHAVRNSKMMAWHNVNIIAAHTGSAASNVSYVIGKDGQVYMVVRIEDLDPSDNAALGDMRIDTGFAIGEDPTQKYYQHEGGTVLIPLVPGTYYIPILGPAGTEADAKVAFRFKDEKSAEGPPKLKVTFTTAIDLDKDKQTGASDTPTVAYTIEP
jgi:subtilisin family serine protease